MGNVETVPNSDSPRFPGFCRVILLGWTGDAFDINHHWISGKCPDQEIAIWSQGWVSYFHNYRRFLVFENAHRDGLRVALGLV